MAGGGPDTQGGRRILRHRPSGADVKGGDGDYQLPLHHLHCLPQHPPWFPGMLRNMYRLPQGQTSSEVNSHEVGGPVRDIS